MISSSGSISTETSEKKRMLLFLCYLKPVIIKQPYSKALNCSLVRCHYSSYLSVSLFLVDDEDDVAGLPLLGRGPRAQKLRKVDARAQRNLV